MNKKEFCEAVAIAKSDADLTKEDTNMFLGFGLVDFEPVTVTLKQVAHLIRWQAQYMNGQWDEYALNEVRTYGRRRFVIIP